MTPERTSPAGSGPAARDWRAEARALAETHTLRETATEVGVAYETLRGWASAEGVAFLAPDPIPAPEPVVMDDGDRCRMLRDLMEAERQATRRRAMGRCLWALTSRPEEPRDVAGALARLGGC